MPRIWRPAISSDLDESLKTSGDSAQPTSFGSEVIPVMQWPAPCEGFRDVAVIIFSGGAGQALIFTNTLTTPANVMRYISFADVRVAAADAVLQRFRLQIFDRNNIEGALSADQTANQVGAAAVNTRAIVLPPGWTIGARAFGSGAFTTLNLTLSVWFKDFKLTEHLPPY